MTNPIEVAARALIPYSGASTNRELQARKTFESIDVDDLADVLSTQTTCDGKPHVTEVHRRQARAVKAHLTGKEHTMNIPQAAVDAACDAYHRPGRMITNTAVGSHHDRMTAALEAAIPELLDENQRLATFHDYEKSWADELESERDSLAARLAAVEKLHQPALMPKPEGGALKVCAHCAKQMHAVEERAVWPCDTIKAARGE